MRGHWVYLALTAVGVALALKRPGPRWRTGVLVASVATLGFLRLELPSVHCIVEGLASRLTAEFLKAPMLAMVAIAFLPTLFFGRVFCSSVCPKGALQELLWVRRWRLRIPRVVDRALRLVPYASLALLVLAPALIGSRVWARLDPFLWAFQWHGHLEGLVLLGLVLPASLVLLRPFCRYLCPLVPIFRALARIAPPARSVRSQDCIGCSKGARACGFDVVSSAGEPRACRFAAQECLACGSCADACPGKAIA